MKYANIREEELKNSVAADFFSQFDCTGIIGNIDFAVKLKHTANTVDFADRHLLWAEAKTGSRDIFAMFTQLVLTAGKARTFDKHLPPPFLGAFDGEKIAFVPYSEIQDVFYQNDFNWKVTSSNTETKEFQQVCNQIKNIVENDISRQTYIFDFEKDEKELRRFIRENFIAGKSATTKIKIDKNNFIIIYNKWFETVKPTIAVNWDIAKKNGIIDGDFYLADLLSDNNQTIKDKLSVLLKINCYETNRRVNDMGMFSSDKADFSDNQKAYNQFWAKYERPPHEDYWDYIVERRDLLVPQDIRERQGSFFTPQIWVELSQRYIADVLGEDCQDEYYVWDCAAGTGNLLAGLTNKYNIWASTLMPQDVGVMHDRIRNGANLLEDHVFQFDFLNDDFSKLPEGLQKIINHPQLRKRLIIYINPPYAEAATADRQGNKTGVSKSKTKEKYKDLIGNANNEIFAQFLIRIYSEIPAAKIANFSKLKNLQSSNFSDFRKHFRAKIEKIFLVSANTFDNVTGQFPIGFFVWNTEKKEAFKQITASVYEERNKESRLTGLKNIHNYDRCKYINAWYKLYYDNRGHEIGVLNTRGNDFQNQNYISSTNNFNHTNIITPNNLIESCIYFAVRKVIPADWLNDRDQFLYPCDGWKNGEFQNDCLAYTLFNTNISIKEGVNHWIPFTESEVNARSEFESHFMVSFLSGKIIRNAYADLFDGQEKPLVKREFSPEAQAVFDAGRELWRYYHAQKNINVNAALYDIKEYFQGRSGNGKMNNKSADEHYGELIGNLWQRKLSQKYMNMNF